MKLWIDECLSPTLVARANRRGYWATCNRDRDLLGAADKNLHELVIDEEAVFVTNDEADFVVLYQRVDLHAGLLILPQTERRPAPRRVATRTQSGHIKPITGLRSWSRQARRQPLQGPRRAHQDRHLGPPQAGRGPTDPLTSGRYCRRFGVLGSDLHARRPHRTKLRPAKTTVLLLALAAALLVPSAAQALPPAFFGIAPQTPLGDTDAAYMRAARIGSVRWPVNWATVQPTAKGGYDWSSVDPAVASASRHGLTFLPFLYGTPSWIAKKPTTLPVDSGRARKAWLAFVNAAVARYGPGGEFWEEHAPEHATANNVPAVPRPLPVRTWQVWNEANFFYFAYPASPSRYARLLKITYREIKADDPIAKVVLSGLFGNPDEGGSKGMDAAKFLAALYRVPGIKSYFDGVALHPYAFHVEDLEGLTEELREVVVDNHDRGVGLYVTEMGWGSQNDPNVVAFEQGIQGQARELRKAYGFLIANRRKLNLKATYWYSWKDNPEYTACSFCDSVGLFRTGKGFKPKPAWRAFIALTGGRARP